MQATPQPIMAAPVAGGGRSKAGAIIAVLAFFILAGGGVMMALLTRSSSSLPSASVPAAAVSLTTSTAEDIPLSDAEAQALAREFYTTQSEWAGQYVMSNVLQTRFDQIGANTFAYHVQYNYSCIQQRCEGSRTGQDQRIFYFQLIGTQWQVTHMGGHMSATF